MGGGWKGLGGAFVRLKVLLLKEPNMAPRAPMLFLFSVLTTFKVCVGAHKEMPPVHPPSPPQDPPHNICMKMGPWLRRLWRNFQIHRSVIPFLWFRLKVEIHSGQSVSELLRMDGPS